MGLSIWVRLAMAIVAVSAGPAPAPPARTQVIRWSPFTASGAVKPSLRLRTISGGCGDASGAEEIGGVGYTCGFRNYIIKACWAEGAGPTDSAICPWAPWDRAGVRIHYGPRFIFDQGVTYGAALGVPWALELWNGNRCEIIATGTGPMPTPLGPLTDRWSCAHGINLGEPLRKGRLWTAAAARNTARLDWIWVGYLPIRRVYFAGLPPTMARQNRLAEEAAHVASKVALARVQRGFGKKWNDVGVHRVRLAFPGMTWANVAVWVFTANLGEHDVSVILHRTPAGWMPVAPKAVCPTLPGDVRAQLLAGHACPHSPH